MKLTVKTKYGLSVLSQLSSESLSAPVTGRLIASTQKISEPYVEQIMIPLIASGIVRTIRGSKGGYMLNKDSSNITLLDIIEAYEGKLDFSSIDESDKTTTSLQSCKGKKVWKFLEESIKSIAFGMTLDVMIKKFINNSKEGEYII